MAKRGAPGFLPEALRRARERRGWSKVELARRVGVSQSLISAYERVEGGKAPTAERLAVIAEVLAARPSDFIDAEAEGLAVLRARAGLSQREVVARLDDAELKVEWYRSVESGQVRRLRRGDAQALARVLGVEAADVVAAHQVDVARRSAAAEEGSERG